MSTKRRPLGSDSQGPTRRTAKNALTVIQSRTADVEHPTHISQCIAELIGELRPDIPSPIAESFVVEALDTLAGVILDAEWAATRERLYPAAVKAARSRRVYTASYLERRRQQLEDAKPRPGDFPGRIPNQATKW